MLSVSTCTATFSATAFRVVVVVEMVEEVVTDVVEVVKVVGKWWSWL